MADFMGAHKGSEEALLNSPECVTAHQNFPSYLKRFIDIAESQASAVALLTESRSVTYSEIHQKSTLIANHLLDHCCDKTQFIGVYFEKSFEAIISILAILKAGFAYIPIDSTFPDARKREILLQTDLEYVLTNVDVGEFCFPEKVDVLSTSLIFDKDLPDGDITCASSLAGRPELGVSYVLFTSGTTGKPKGVVMPDLALSNLINWQMKFDFFSEPQNTLQFASFGFDVSFQEIFTTLCTGGTLVVANESQRTSYSALAKLIEKCKVTRVFLPFSVLAGLLPYLQRLPHGLRTLVSAGEPLFVSKELKAYCVERSCRLINHYGPTESHVVTQYEVDIKTVQDDSYAAIGGSIDNADLFIINSKMDVVTEAGELVIGGVPLATGYLNDKDLSAEKFIQVNHHGRSVRVYRTGDLVSCDFRGCFHFLHRLDRQIKINGIRVEPKEIELVLMQHENVGRAVVLNDKTGGRSLLLAYVLFNSESALVCDIKTWAAEQLPSHMIPNRIFKVERIPTTVNGKLDENALLAQSRAEIYKTGEENNTAFSPTEKCMLGIWARLLQVSDITKDKNFFELGGNSLLAMKMLAEVEDSLGFSSQLSDIFRYPTISLLASCLEKNGKLGLSKADLNSTKKDRYLASFAQLQMWIESERFGNDYTYNTPIVISIHQKINIEALQLSLDSVVAKHLVLCSKYQFDGSELYQIPITNDGFKIEIFNRINEAEVDGLIEGQSKRPFDLSRERPIRVSLFLLLNGEARLLINIHHIAVDEWSHGILLDQLDQLYRGYITANLSLENGQVKSLAKEAVSIDLRYSEFADFQCSCFNSKADSPELRACVDRLTGCSSELGFARPHKLHNKNMNRGKTKHYSLSKALSSELVAYAKENSMSLYSCLLGVYFILLYRLSGKKDITVGTPISLRDNFDAKDIVGCYLNTIAVRLRVDATKNTFTFLKQVSEALIDAIEYKSVPFEVVVEAISPERSESGASIFSSMFVMRESYDLGRELFGGLCQVSDVFLDVAKFDLTTFVKLDNDIITLSVEYRTDSLDEDVVDRLARGFELVAGQVTQGRVSALEEIEIALDEDGIGIIGNELTTPISIPNSTTISISKTTSISIPEAFFNVCKKRQDSVAITFLNEEVSYQQLDIDANCIAGFLQAKGVSKGGRVGLLCDHKVPGYIAAMLGILKLGAVYVPLDSNSPDERLQYIIDDSACELVLLESAMMGKGLQCKWVEFTTALIANPAKIELSLAADDLAAIMYTSGSTGKPKGVMIPHRGIVRLVSEVNYISLGPDTRCLHLSPPAFDASTFELWAPLLNGGVSVQYPFKDLRLESFGAFLVGENIDTLWLTSSLFNTVIDTYPTALVSLKQLLIGGEVLSISHVNKALILLPNTQLINGYGPTENTTFTSCYAIPKASYPIKHSIPIGTPIQDTSVFILNESLQRLPNGMPGELYVGGKGVALGYLNLSELTAEKFIANKFSGEGRLYATGDICRILADGNIEYIGRRDDQLKIHGRRIELAEIEAAIDQFESLIQVHVCVDDQKQNSRKIIAFVVPNTSRISAFDSSSLREFLSSCLPGYMIPADIVVVSKLPLTLNGKVDRARLLSQWRELNVDSDLVASSSDKNLSDLEVVATSVIASVLDLDDVSIVDNFFALGGNSLLAIQAISEIFNATGVRLALADFFSADSIKELVARATQTTVANSPISLLYSGCDNCVCLTVFHNISLAQNLFNGLGKDTSVLGLLCAKHHAIVSAFEEGRPVEATLSDFVLEYYTLLKKHCPHGPYAFAGHSYGGLIAFELACFMQAKGEPVESVFLLDSILPSALKTSTLGSVAAFFRALAYRCIGGLLATPDGGAGLDRKLLDFYSSLMISYQGPPQAYEGNVILIRSCESVKKICKLSDYGWGRFLLRSPQVSDINGDHFSIIESDKISALTSKIDCVLNSTSSLGKK